MAMGSELGAVYSAFRKMIRTEVDARFLFALVSIVLCIYLVIIHERSLILVHRLILYCICNGLAESRSNMPVSSTFPSIEIPNVDLWTFLFERKDRPYPDDKSILLLIGFIQ